MTNNYGFVPTLDGLNNISSDNMSCVQINANNIFSDFIDTIDANVQNDLTVEGDIQFDPPNGAKMSYDIPTKNLNLRSATTNSKLTLDTYSSGGTLFSADFNSSRAIIPQPYLQVGQTTGTTTEMRVYGSSINGVGKSGFMLTSVNAGGSSPASVPMGLLNVIDELFDIAINCGNVASTRKTSNQGIQMRFDSRNTEPLWALQCVERVTGTVRDSARCTDSGVFQIPNRLDLLLNANMNMSGTGIISQMGTGTNALKSITITSNNNLTMSGTGVILQTGTGANGMKSITMNVDANFTQSGNGIISQTGGGTNALKSIDVSGNVNFTGNLLQNGLPYSAPAGNVLLTSDNTNGNYFIPFSKATAGTNPLFIDDITNPFTYNPSTGLLTMGATTSALNLATSYFGCRGDTTSNYIGVNVAPSATTSAQRNVYIGNNAGAGTTSGGTLNVLIGFEAGKVNNNSHNVSVGYQSLVLGTGNQNTAIGSLADNTITTGAQNTSVGYNSGAKFVGTANFNTCIGRSAGNAMKGNNNTAVGASAYSTDNGTFSNSTAIGFNAQITASNQVVLGTATERVIIPNVIDFSDFTTQRTAYQIETLNACDVLSQLSARNIKTQTWNWIDQATTLTTTTANVLFFSAVKLTAGITYNGIGLFMGTAGGSWEYALYDSGLGASRLAITGTFTATANVMNFRNFTTPYTATATGIYYVAHRTTSATQQASYTPVKNQIMWNYALTTGSLTGICSFYNGTAFPATIPTGQAFTTLAQLIYAVMY